MNTTRSYFSLEDVITVLLLPHRKRHSAAIIQPDLDLVRLTRLDSVHFILGYELIYPHKLPGLGKIHRVTLDIHEELVI